MDDFSLREEKRRKLYESQKELLDTFLKNGAITEAQYRKSFGDLTVKMGFSNQTVQSKEKDE